MLSRRSKHPYIGEMLGQEEGAALYEAAPDAQGIISVRHEPGARVESVQCLKSDGSAVGHLAWVPVSGEEVEVLTLPGSGVEKVRLTFEDPGVAA